MVEYPITTILSNFVVGVANYIPNIVSAVILLVIGLVVGKVLGKITREAIVRMKLEKYLTEGRKLPISIADVFSVIVRWWVYLAFITAALSENVLGIPALATWMSEINAFIPNVVGAVIIIIVGYILGEYIRDQITRSETLYATIVAKVTFFFIMYVAIAMALPILGIPAVLVNSILLVIIGSIGLGMAIAIGLGLKDVIAEISREYLKPTKRKRR
jgi:hypothetical protein